MSRRPRPPRRPAPEKPALFSRRWFLDVSGAWTFALLFFAGWGAMSWLSYPVLVGLGGVRAAWVTPYPSGSYVLLSPLRLEDWPTSVTGIFSIVFRDTPNSLLAVIWTTSTVLQVLFWFTFDRWELPRRSRGGLTRRELMWRRARAKSLLFVGLTTVLCGLSLPGLRVFEVLKGEQLCHRGFFDGTPHCLDLRDLREVRRYRYGRNKGLIGWDLRFGGGTVYTLHGVPSVEVLSHLTSRPHVTSNVMVRSGKVFALER